MAFKYVLLSLCALLGAAHGGNLFAPVATYAAAPVIAKVAQPHYDAVGTTQQNVVRSFGGTVSTYSKNVVTPYSSVSKVDSRTTNNVYTPAVAKTVYSAPVVTKSYYTAEAPSVAAPVAYTKTYAAPAPVVTKTYAAPAVYAAPAPVFTKTYAAPAPVVAKTYAAPAVYAAPAPVFTKTYAAPAPVIAKTYAAPAPAVYATAPTAFVKYSPAATVAHVSFDGFGAHWGY
ncbi:pupal cuticle protein G1A [Scaptodrosophila lebanonensis]|uniref:Pupal cuticle protein G1A n=1 Tax=Drosophila lebanonensis TaxID=7225 RepID=A0A6J2TXJ9_DROLE|nr:pupal cuticle protein G1A [Scaptodrosophila lebanonensis]